MLPWTKAAHCVWTAPLKQSLFLKQRRRKRANWLNTDWVSVEDGEGFVVLLWFSLNSASHYCAEHQAVRGGQNNCAWAQGPPRAMGGPYFDGGLSIIRTDSMMGSDTHWYHCTTYVNSRQHPDRPIQTAKCVPILRVLMMTCDVSKYELYQKKYFHSCLRQEKNVQLWKCLLQR